MTVYGYVLPGAIGIARSAALTESLTERARYKVKVFDWWRAHGKNSYVEISHGADKREFYQQGNAHVLLSVMQRKIKEWEDVWNTVRPHASLNYLTPQEYLEKHKQGRLPTRDTIVLQA